jgi:hypothetical protein
MATDPDKAVASNTPHAVENRKVRLLPHQHACTPPSSKHDLSAEYLTLPNQPRRQIPPWPLLLQVFLINTFFYIIMSYIQQLLQLGFWGLVLFQTSFLSAANWYMQRRIARCSEVEHRSSSIEDGRRGEKTSLER